MKYQDKIFKLFAHRIIWLLNKKTIDPDLELDHKSNAGIMIYMEPATARSAEAR